jgi:hypothetical protein
MRRRARFGATATCGRAGVRYTSDKLGSARVSATTDGFARRTAARETPGPVEVCYDSQNRAEAILDPRGRGLLLIWLIPLAVLTLAFAVALTPPRPWAYCDAPKCVGRVWDDISLPAALLQRNDRAIQHLSIADVMFRLYLSGRPRPLACPALSGHTARGARCE